MTKYTRLNFVERAQIFQLKKAGCGVRETARILDRSPSTISRELKRRVNVYHPIYAQKNAKILKRRRRRKHKIKGALLAIIEQLLLELRFSPEQISNFLKLKYPNFTELHVSPESIYRYIYMHPMRNKLIRFLRRKKKKRGQRRIGNFERGGMKNRVSIHERPKIIENREEVGHWEGDLIVGTRNRSAIGTLVERSTRFTIIVNVPNKSSKAVVSAFIEQLRKLPPFLRKSLTYDNGSEMSFHARLQKELGVNVYFADPGCPWQRGTNENTNGLLRDFFPKGVDLNRYSEEELSKAQDIINLRAKKVLGFARPLDAIEWSKKNPKKPFSSFIEEQKTILKKIN